MLNALIVDDEQPARRRLRKLLEPMHESERLRIIGEAGDGVEALDQIDAQSVDVLFLDIQMPEMDGFDVLDEIGPEIRPEVIFITAYDEYALRAFEANAIDYLLKPISKERLEEAISRVEQIRQAPDLQEISSERLRKLLDWVDSKIKAEENGTVASEDYVQQLSISYRDRIRLVSIDQIVAVEINEGITRLFVLEDEEESGHPSLRQHVVDYTLDHLEENLDPEAFMRVHRSAIVQIHHIKEMIPWFSGRYKLVMRGNHEVIASRKRSKKLKDRLMI